MRRLAAATLALLLAVPSAGAAPLTPDQQAYMDVCANIFNFLPRIVRKSQVQAIGPDKTIVFHEICIGVPLYDFGNAGGLTKTIAANPALAAALAANGWTAENVVGIGFAGEHTVNFYVHRD